MHNPVLAASVLDTMVGTLDQDSVNELLGVFETELNRRLEMAKTAKAEGDLDSLMVQTHTVGSSAKTFGAIALHVLAREIEESCEHGDVRAFDRFDDFEHLLLDTIRELSAYRGR